MKMIILVRRDLQMSTGKTAAQAAHAAVEALADPKETPANVIEEWYLNHGMTKVCLGVDSLEELLSLVDSAEKASLVTAIIEDEGRTSFNGVLTVTCGAIGPAKNEDIDKITGHLTLL